MVLIGLSGKIGSGKTTVANLLLQKLEGRCKRRAFGDAIKEEISTICGFPLLLCYEAKDQLVKVPARLNPPKHMMYIRDLLQWWGAVQRAVEPNYWVDSMSLWLIRNADNYDYVIVDDVRFHREAAIFLTSNEYLFRIETYEGWTCDPDQAADISETDLDNYTDWDAYFFPMCGALDNVVTDIDNIIQGGGLFHAAV